MHQAKIVLYNRESGYIKQDENISPNNIPVKTGGINESNPVRHYSYLSYRRIELLLVEKLTIA